jgi:hypothetical protein
MLAYPAHVYRLDVMFGKLSTLFGKKIDESDVVDC